MHFRVAKHFFQINCYDIQYNKRLGTSSSLLNPKLDTPLFDQCLRTVGKYREIGKERFSLLSDPNHPISPETSKYDSFKNRHGEAKGGKEPLEKDGKFAFTTILSPFKWSPG
ncbi:hypothetical protein TNCT_127211 [Trichonephila clavata]|uniref:Uncharacterized protein n=1 Tax=Trichonephila clavata TaxID=2740835 RepID=A0A8X6LJQ3_TRICU|nr:hypothetical protein TNCT_127211 [Trichonephila clavata]